MKKMRHFIAITIALTAVILQQHAYAENPEYIYQPILVDGRSWTCVERVFSIPYSYDVTFSAKIAGDSIIDGKNCKRIEFDAPVPLSSYECPIYLYEDNGRLFYVCRQGDFHSFLPLFDFNFNKGDKILYYDYFSNSYDDGNTSLIVDNVCDISINGAFHKSMIIHYVYATGKTRFENCWVEGIGASEEYAIYPFGIVGSHLYRYMVDCKDNGVTIFQREDFPSFLEYASIDQIDSDAERSDYIYDMFGRKVIHPKSGFIYISNGKKFKK